jgi:hypothetical protein
MDSTFYIAITAHNPLTRFDPLLKALRAYDQLPGHKCVDIYVDYEHSKDVSELQKLIEPHFFELDLVYSVAPLEYTGYFLTWAHKPRFKQFVKQKAFTYYIYAENDMLFSLENFNYWVKYKDILRSLNLEPGFCRYETVGEQKIPFDNYKKWVLNDLTPEVWGDRPYEATTQLYLGDSDFVGFVSLGNPYAGLMILDKADAERYVESDSFDPQKSYALTAHRNWPIADRSSMGLAFEGLLPHQEHRRVVPLVCESTGVRIPDCALVEHLDVKYSPLLVQNGNSTITVDTMFHVK